MVMRNKTANLYTEWKPLIDGLSNEEAGIILKNILSYQNGDEISNPNPVWIFIKSKLDEYNNKLIQISEKRKQNGKLGGIAKASKCYQMIAKDGKCSNKIKENKIKENKINNNTYNRYGELKNVCLTEEDYNKLLVEHPNLSYAIEKLDGWLDTKNGEKNKNRNHRCYFKSNSWVWDKIKTEEKKILIEPYKFFMDEDEKYSPGYSDLVKQLPEEERWKIGEWITQKFNGQEIGVSIIRNILIKAIQNRGIK